MLTIRQDQMKALRSDLERRFVERLAAYLRRAHPDTVVRLPGGAYPLGQLPGQTLRRMVGTGCKRAGRYGLRRERDLSAFIALMVEIAPNFDRQPRIGAVLGDTWLPPEQRLQQIWKRTGDADWRAAREAYDPRAWSAGGEPVPGPAG